ncbi:carboxymuconolactone decarboxylase family protein [Oceanibium sediminis]|uniref:carboxymuconolactone decarboxylase family protein n=1 Tax=Oceanibium sediminis TaxID=2026339 RepID=UPI000DD2F261|nr:carboxymuconolactone decarboxylase family protein [Oceanibium sediminis]
MQTPDVPDFLHSAGVYRAMGQNPALLRAWAPLRAHVVTQNALGAYRLEIVILRAAHAQDSSYEWAHHVVRGRQAGLDDALIAALKGPLTGLEGEAALLAETVDALSGTTMLPPSLRDRLIAHLGEVATLDLIATVGFYSTLAFILKTFDVALDAEIVEALDAAPLTED